MFFVRIDGLKALLWPSSSSAAKIQEFPKVTGNFPLLSALGPCLSQMTPVTAIR
jgi:hypothetical protein